MSYIEGKWRQKIHLEPPSGWMNDPNGLCFFNGYYHVYFQYTPTSATGDGERIWGHYRSKDMLTWEFMGSVLFQDTPEDKDGVYSGSAVVVGDTLHIFYTGNVKEPGNHDYIKSGRGANVIHVTTTDGDTMSKKQVQLKNADYPAFCSNHVRDPKIWQEDGKWHMVLGARSLDDKGLVLFYESADLNEWTYTGCDSIEDFGYMWECPDVLTVSGHKYLSLSPQGLPHEEYDNQNVYSSGYFSYDEKLEDFKEWDKGFDFYAPQTYVTPDNRRIIIGWMGIGDIPYTNPTIELGYQHCLTLPRVVTRAEDGTLLQQPVSELEALRKAELQVRAGQDMSVALAFDMTAEVTGPFSVTLDGGLNVSWDGKEAVLQFLDDKMGCGRDVRKAHLTSCSNLRLIADTSALEVYLDDGRVVFSTRMYPASETVALRLEGLEARLYPLEAYEMHI